MRYRGAGLEAGGSETGLDDGKRKGYRPNVRDAYVATVACLATLLLVYCASLWGPGRQEEVFPVQKLLPLEAQDSGECQAACGWVFERYVASQWEQSWTNNIGKWKNKVCPTLREQEAEVDMQVKWAKEAWDAPPTSDPVPTLSRFEYHRSCDGEKRIIYIEPLVGIQRHPRLCWNLKSDGAPLEEQHKMVFNMEYLVFDWNLPLLMRDGGGHAYLMDIGCGTWKTGITGYFTEILFDKRKIFFDHIYGWEKEGVSPTQFWSEVPPRFKHLMHYANIPVSSAPDSADNPNNYVRQFAKEEDFVVYKLDIDTTPVEEAIVKQIVADPALAKLVDVVIWEYHVDIPEMHYYWNEIPERDLTHHYDLFVALRKMGVQAHVWV